MKIAKDGQCILCPYKKDEDCMTNHEKCWSLSNIYYGYIVKIFPFKQIDRIRTVIAYKKEERYNAEMDKKYGDCAKENDDIKFIWGVTSWDDLSGHEANLYTMNDIDICYDKKDQEYMLGIETAYIFDDYEASCRYLQSCLDAFTRYVKENDFTTSEPYPLFFSNPCTSLIADNIPELYTNFKIFVDGYCTQRGEKK